MLVLVLSAAVLVIEIVAMLTRLAFRADSVSESPATYGIDYEHEHEHRCAEHEKW